MTIFGEFAEQLRKAAPFSSCLPVSLHGKIRIKTDVFPWNSVFGIFTKIHQYILALVDLERNNKYFTWCLHKYMTVVATNVTILFLWSQWTMSLWLNVYVHQLMNINIYIKMYGATIKKFPVVTLGHLLPYYLGYKYYPVATVSVFTLVTNLLMFLRFLWLSERLLRFSPYGPFFTSWKIR
jgi:hypothetical protein